MRRIAKSLQILVVQTLAFTTEPSSYSPMVAPDATSASSPKTAFPDSPFKTVFPPSRDSSRRGTPAATAAVTNTALESLDPYLPHFLKRVLRHPNRLYHLNELFHRLSRTIKSLKTEKRLARLFLDQNRYVDVLPFDHSLVQLSDGAYINASWVHTTIQYNNTSNTTTANSNANSDSKWYIVAQAPLPHTLHCFWQMVAENGVRVIVCLTRLEEAGRERCTQYWPNSQGEPLLLSSNLKLWLVRESLLFEGSVVHRELCLEAYGKSLTIHQLHYLGWPDQGVPSCTRTVAQMAVLSKQLSAQSNDLPAAPVLVHCSAGIGRSGAFCAIDSVLESISLKPIFSEEFEGEEDIVLKTITEMRRWRPYLVQNAAQFAFCYDVLTNWMQDRVQSALSAPIGNIAISSHEGEEDEDDERLPTLTLNEDSLLNEEEVMSIVSEYDDDDDEDDDDHYHEI